MSEHPEDAIQRGVFDYLLRVGILDEPLIHPLIFHPPNGMHLAGSGLQRAKQANRMKSLGMVPGVVDIICLIPRNGHPFAAWECKAPGRRNELNGGLSDSQMEFMAAAESVGAYTGRIDDVDEGCRDICQYLGIEYRIWQ